MVKYSLIPRDLLKAHAIFHSESRLESQYRHFHLPSNGAAALGEKVAVTAVPANVAVAV